MPEITIDNDTAAAISAAYSSTYSDDAYIDARIADKDALYNAIAETLVSFRNGATLDECAKQLHDNAVQIAYC